MGKSLSLKQRQQLMAIANNVQEEIAAPLSAPDGADIAFVQLMRICRDYATTGHWGRSGNADMLIKRLDKFKTRFYETI